MVRSSGTASDTVAFWWTRSQLQVMMFRMIVMATPPKQTSRFSVLACHGSRVLDRRAGFESTSNMHGVLLLCSVLWWVQRCPPLYKVAWATSSLRTAVRYRIDSNWMAPSRPRVAEGHLRILRQLKLLETESCSRTGPRNSPQHHIDSAQSLIDDPFASWASEAYSQTPKRP